LGAAREREDAGTDAAPSPSLTDAASADADSGRAAWITVFALLALITVFNLAWTFRQPLLENDAVQVVLTAVGLVEPRPAEPFHDTSMIHLVSRDLHDHPAREGLLVLSATFVNRADQPQAYPDIRLTLSDDANEPLASRTFTPADYLPGGAPSELLAPMVHVPVLLEFVDPGNRAVGFELKFE